MAPLLVKELLLLNLQEAPPPYVSNRNYAWVCMWKWAAGGQGSQPQHCRTLPK